MDKQNIDSNESEILIQRLSLKKYALCRCIIEKFPNDTLLRTDGSLYGYLELGSHSNIAYQKVDSFLQKNLSVHYTSKNKSRLYLMQCIDLCNSNQLDSLIKKMDVYLSTQ